MIKSMKHAYKLGFHASVAGGLHHALLKAQGLGCNTVQIFSRNPRGWQARPLSFEVVKEFRDIRAKTRIRTVVIHANYLINLAAADPNIREKSRESFREEVARGVVLDADYLVVHPGSAKDATEEQGIKICAASLKAACAKLELGRLRILLENTAGQGACIGHRFEHLRDIIALCPKLNLGVCLDTAHSFTAGYDLRDPDGFSAAMQSLNKNVGLKNVRVVHFNDSKAAYNSRVDRHWHIGKGEIGADGLRRVASFPKLKHAAFILETPQDEDGSDVTNLNVLRSYVAAT
ncbi:MAG: deoxyribonuclease IV [Pyrinomonadaceae bacterium]